MDEVQVEFATATPPLFEIIFRSDESNAQQVIDTMTKCIERKEEIRLLLHFDSRTRFDSTLEMQNTIFENLIHIKSLKFKNHYHTHIGGFDNGQIDEHKKCFNLFARIVQECIGAIQNFDYDDLMNMGSYTLDEFNHLATAIRSNTNGTIESFKIHVGHNMNIDLFQPLWNALLDTGVQKVNLCGFSGPSVFNRINNLNFFIRLSTNKSLTELRLSGGRTSMLRQDWRDLFNSIKSNTGLKKLTLPQFHNEFLYDDEGERLFTEMLRMNTSLIDVTIDANPALQLEIKTETELNRMWKQCTTEDKKEGTHVSIATAVVAAAAAATATANHDNNNNAIIHDNNVAAIVVSDIEREQQQEEEKKREKEKEEKRKKFKMRVLLHVALNKSVLRDTVIFQLLSDYPDVFLCDDNNDDDDENRDEEGNDQRTVVNNRIRRMLLSALVPPTDTSVALPTAPVAVAVAVAVGATVTELSVDLQAATELNAELHTIIEGNDQVVEDRDATIMNRDATIATLRDGTTVLQEEIENLRLMYDNLMRSMTQTIQDK